MAQIGRPQVQNPFTDVKMHQGAKKNKKKAVVGDQLNKIAGIKPDSKFVDAKTHNKLGKDGFLKLLSHQLANQDPMKPMDQKRFAADLAQFSQLEQMANMNKKLTNLGSNAPQENKFYGASFLGKEVMTSGTTIDHAGDGADKNLPFFLPKNASAVMVRVFDGRNQMVAQIEKQSMGQGSQAVNWDGINLDGTPATKDKYRFEVRAWDSQMNEFKGETKAVGIVTGVNFENGETILTIDGKKKVFVRDIESFKLPETTENKTDKAPRNNLPALQKSAASKYNNIDSQMN
jgi:flagellar basal-body rod modification protein FlgD